jgi:hypothetical protein
MGRALNRARLTERRHSPRRSGEALSWIREFHLRPRLDATLVNLSEEGAVVETSAYLCPGVRTFIHLAGPSGVPCDGTRCPVARRAAVRSVDRSARVRVRARSHARAQAVVKHLGDAAARTAGVRNPNGHLWARARTTHGVLRSRVDGQGVATTAESIGGNRDGTPFDR